MSLGDRADAAHLRRVIAEIEAKAGFSPALEARAARRAPFARAFDSILGGGLAENGLHEIVPAAPRGRARGDGFRARARGPLSRPSSGFGAPDRRELREPRSGRALWAWPRRSWAPVEPARVRLRSRRAFSLLGDGGGAEMRRARRGGGRGLELEALWAPGLPPPADSRAKGRRRRRSSCSPAPTARRMRCPPPPRPASRSPPRRAPEARRPAAAIFPARSPAWRGWSRRALQARSRSPSEDGRPSGRPVERDSSVSRAQRTRPQGDSRLHDPTRAVRLEWRYEEGIFDDPAISLALAAASGDGPRAASP